MRLSVTGSGYSAIRVDGVDKPIYVHRLAAVAEHGVAAIREGVDVHHVDGLKWVNNPERLQPIPSAEHRAMTLRVGGSA